MGFRFSAPGKAVGASPGALPVRNRQVLGSRPSNGFTYPPGGNFTLVPPGGFVKRWLVLVVELGSSPLHRVYRHKIPVYIFYAVDDQ